MKFSHVLLAAAAAVTPGAAEAAITINIDQVGANVVVTGSGSFNTAGLPTPTTNSYSVVINPGRGAVLVGGQALSSRYITLSPTTVFGPGNFFYFPDSASGQTFGIYGQDGALFLPVGYVSGAALSGTSTYNNRTIALLGLNAGVYTLSNANDSVTINIGQATPAVPEPATWGLMILGLGAVGYSLRRRSKVSTGVKFA